MSLNQPSNIRKASPEPALECGLTGPEIPARAKGEVFVGHTAHSSPTDTHTLSYRQARPRHQLTCGGPDRVIEDVGDT